MAKADGMRQRGHLAPMIDPLKEVARDARRIMKRAESRESVCRRQGMSYRQQFPANAAAGDSSYTYAEGRRDYEAYQKRPRRIAKEMRRS